MVIVVTRAKPVKPEIRGIDSDIVVSFGDILTGKVEAGGRVAIIGGGQVGCETAEFLMNMGRDVTVIEMLDEICSDMGVISRYYFLRDLEKMGLKIMVNSMVEEITEGGVAIKTMDMKKRLEVDTVVTAAGFEPNRELIKDLEAVDYYKFCAVGDCVAPDNILRAIHEGAVREMK